MEEWRDIKKLQRALPSLFGRVKSFHKGEEKILVPQVDHIDTNKTNCRASNLRWATSVGNQKYAITN